MEVSPPLISHSRAFTHFHLSQFIQQRLVERNADGSIQIT